MIPFAGWGATGGKWGKRIYKAADTGGNLAGGAGHKITKNVLEHLSPEEAARVKKLGSSSGMFRPHEAESAMHLEGILGRKLEPYHNADLDWFDPVTKKTYDLMGGQKNIDISKMSRKSIDGAIEKFGESLQTHLIKADVTVIDLRFWPKEMKDGSLKILDGFQNEISTGKIILWVE